MKKLFTLLNLLTVLIFAAPQVEAQVAGKITGTVITSDNEPAAGVTVTLIENKRIAITNAEGKYSFKVKPGTYTIKISLVGMKSEEKNINVSEGQSISTNFTLSENLAELNEVNITSVKTNNRKKLSAGKINAPAMDLPMAVSTIGKNMIEQQQAIRLSEVIRNANGVYLSSTRGGTQETFASRGYGFSSNNMFRNGFRVNTGAMPEMSSIEQVEILKGSAALLYGNVAPGGILNIVTKKPEFDAGGKISMTYGSYSLYKPAFDVWGPLSSKVAYRVNGTYENAQSYRDVVSTKRYYVNPSLLFKVSDKTIILAEGDYLYHNFTPDFGTGAVDGQVAMVPRNRYLGAVWSDGVTKQATATVSVNHNFNGNWQLNGGVSYQNYNREYQGTERIQPVDGKGGDFGRPLNHAKVLEDYYTGQLNLSGKVSTGKIEHNILVGIDADKYKNTSYTYVDANKYLNANNEAVSAVYDSSNVYNPGKFTQRTDEPVMNPFRYAVTPTNRFGAYVNDLISLSEKLKVLAGLRWSYQYASPVETHNFVDNTDTKAAKGKEDKAFSPKVGIVFKPISTTAFFASYSNSFIVNTGLDISGNSLKPSIVDQYEVGIKNDWLNGNLSVNLTAYRILNNNLAQTDPTNTAFKKIGGKTKSDGIELDIAGHPVKGLDLMAGYSYNNARFGKIDEIKGNNISGEKLINNPKHTANASAFYTFCNGDVKGLKIGLSAFYIGERLGGFQNTVGQTQTYSRLIAVKGFTTVDASAGYTFKKLSLIAKVSNIRNVLNWAVHENYSINPIAPRQFITTAAYRF